MDNCSGCGGILLVRNVDTGLVCPAGPVCIKTYYLTCSGCGKKYTMTIEDGKEVILPPARGMDRIGSLDDYRESEVVE